MVCLFVILWISLRLIEDSILRSYLKTDWFFWVFQVVEQLLLKTLTKNPLLHVFWLLRRVFFLLLTAFMMSEVKNYHVNVTIQGFLKQNQWKKNICRMYSLAVMQSISNSTTIKNIGKIKCWCFCAKYAFLHFSNQPRKNTYTSMDIPSPPLFIASKLGKYCLVLFLIFKPFDAIFGQNTKCTAKNALWSQNHFIKALGWVISFFCLFIYLIGRQEKSTP